MSALLENFKVHIHAKTKSESSAVNITDYSFSMHNEYMYVCTLLEYNDIFFSKIIICISKQPVILLDK